MKYGTLAHQTKPMPRIIVGSDFLLGQDKAISFASYDAYWADGGRSFDSAHCYGDNSRVLGEWVAAHGVAKDVIFFDKGCHPYGQPRVTHADMKSDILENHERLGVDYTDLFVLHRDNPEIPVGEIIDWLNEFKAEGLIGAFGGSNWHHTRIAAANEYAIKAGKQGLSLNNPNLSLAVVNEPMWADSYTIDPEGRKWHAETHFPLCAWSSMARGYFAGVTGEDVNRVYDNPTSQARKARAVEVGDNHGLSAPQIALAWTLAQPGDIYALCGLRNVDNVKQTLAALDLELTPEEVRYLEFGNE